MPCKHILIVDDNEDLLFFLEYGIRQSWPDYNVLTATNSRTALEQLQQQAVDLMLIDYKLPGMNGLDLAQTVRQIAPQIQIVMMSANKPEELEDRVASLQLAGYVDKPFRVSEIQRFVAPG
jgi:DNA-binding response OmpR family regulator